MINILKIVILKIFSLLPDSPFTDFFNSMDTSYLEYLNWFLPVKTCASIFTVWCECVAIYYLFCILKKVLSFVIEQIAKAAAMAAMFV